jgi:apolipoprotein N-acyltransferase
VRALAAPLRQRRVMYALAVLVTPALHGLCFPPASLAPAAWVAFVPWFVAIRLATLAEAVALSCIVTLAGSYFVASWLPRAVATYYAQPLGIGITLFAGVWAVTVAPWVIAFTLGYRALARRFVVALPLLAGAAWVAAELGRVRLLIGDPFGLFGYTQIDIAPVVQIADISGPYGVSFVLVAANVALAELWLSSTGAQHRAAAVTGLGVVGATVAVVVAYGVLRLRASIDPATAARSTRVAIVQGNLDLGSQWRPEFYGRNLDVYMRLTLKALHESAAALVFWPESAMTFFLEQEPLYQAAIARMLGPGDVQLLAGGPRSVGRPQPRYYNSALLISSSGRILAWYDKRQLLPFAEYFPFSSVELLRREFARVREFTPGGPSRPLPTVAGAAGVVICNEVMFPEIVAQRVRTGAEYLVNLSNDTWLGDAQFAAEAFDMARLRAIEQRRYLVRASTSGPSAIIDPWGTVLVQTPSVSRATVAGNVRTNSTVTFYGCFGDVFGVLCAAVMIAGLAAAGAGSRAPAQPVPRAVEGGEQCPGPASTAGPSVLSGVTRWSRARATPT